MSINKVLVFMRFVLFFSATWSTWHIWLYPIYGGEIMGAIYATVPAAAATMIWNLFPVKSVAAQTLKAILISGSILAVFYWITGMYAGIDRLHEIMMKTWFITALILGIWAAVEVWMRMEKRKEKNEDGSPI